MEDCKNERSTMIKNLFIIVGVIDGKEYAIRHRAKADQYYISIGDNAFMDNEGSDMVVGISPRNMFRENPGQEFFEEKLGVKFEQFYIKKFAADGSHK